VAAVNNGLMIQQARRIRDEVLEAAPVRGIRIVGIDGPSGAGKSTLALELASLLDAPVIQIDDFVSWNDFAGWWPRFERQVLDPLLRGRTGPLSAKGLGRR
jgi:pantothenate kinase-related protein Tda10